MDLLKVYESFSDATRLRIMHLLIHRSSLCVCHIQDILQEPQVKISRHLAYLRRRELVIASQHGTWRYYSLPETCSQELQLNLDCLETLTQKHPLFKRDRKRLEQLVPATEACCP
jgi:ArsR family transcriptional regulator